MAKFLTGNELNSELEKIFEDAENQLILISPFIKLHERYKSILKAKRNNHKLAIYVVFGKNEEDRSKSLNVDDLDFFKGFPNIQIRYEKRLHAKYYANESSAILTSMNLYSYSHDNNIESGVLVKSSPLGELANMIISNVMNDEGLDKKAWNCFMRVIDQSEPLFYRKPRYENAMLGLSKRYIDSVTELDKLSQLVLGSPGVDRISIKTNGPPVPTEGRVMGYCIRTGTQIPFNYKHPMCEDAYRQWVKSGKQDMSEHYCHFSGEPSHGGTSYSKPILKKNWSKAKQVHDF